MFHEFMKLAVPLAIVGLICACLSDGAGRLIPIAIVGAVIFVLAHAAKGFERADRNRRNRY